MVNSVRVFLKIVLAMILGFFLVFTVSMIFLMPKNNNHVKQINSSNISVVFLGDSLTFGVGDTTGQQGYTGRVIKLLKKTYPQYHFSSANFGKPGDRSDQILKRLNKSEKQQKLLKNADIVVMTAGGNDLRQELMSHFDVKSAAALSNEIKKNSLKYHHSLNQLFIRIKQIRQKSSLFVFGNYNPAFVNIASRTDLNKDVQLYNAVNQRIVEKQADGHYISVFRQLTYGQYQRPDQIKKLIQEDKTANATTENKFQKSLLDGSSSIKNNFISQADHFHPNNLGYSYMAKQLFNSILSDKSWQTK